METNIYPWEKAIEEAEAIRLHDEKMVIEEEIASSLGRMLMGHSIVDVEYHNSEAVLVLSNSIEIRFSCGGVLDGTIVS